MPHDWQLHERRAADRPMVGNRQPCLVCYEGVLEFTDRYRASSPSGAATMAIPAWVCDHCPYVRRVRAEQQAEMARNDSRNERALANRKLMKARAVVRRANRTLQKSLDRKRKRSE